MKTGDDPKTSDIIQAEYARKRQALFAALVGLKLQAEMYFPATCRQSFAGRKMQEMDGLYNELAALSMGMSNE